MDGRITPWDGGKHRRIHGKFRVHSHSYIQPSAVIIPYLELAGFANVAKISSLKVDSKLIVALLERWRPETHTFHLPTGECTITLEDVSMLFGLRIHGKAVNGPTNVTNDVYMENLGIEPTASDKNGASVKIVWLEAVLTQLKNNPNPSKAENILHAKIYILLLIATFLMPDKSHNLLHSSWLPLVGDLEKCNSYSWGSACLATLYRHMCKAAHKGVKSIGGCVVLLTVWAFTCIPLIAPVSNEVPSFPYALRWCKRGMNYRTNPRHHLQGYRVAIEHMEEKDFIWRPLIQYPVPDYNDSRVWSATTYIICFYTVEMHQTDRVKLQFGFEQQIPSPPRCLSEHHNMTMVQAWDTH
ncbi:serine/threonine-protein phosphatase 7 long form homolog [Lathyrus oleraceus]|uniref:serine/threonine-protein phosphatase 7 long form homolog n=1 Tax=Pisum sativum TaxID=3888 RepID=UPI0021CE0483|nr:serine/threonine-protein phosphatase 7 long form homolog [Pisum sativum]